MTLEAKLGRTERNFQAVPAHCNYSVTTILVKKENRTEEECALSYNSKQHQVTMNNFYSTMYCNM